MSTVPASRVTFHGYTFELEQVPCDFCGGGEFLPFWERMRHGLNLPTVFCKSCGLCTTNPRPTTEANALFYSELYNKFHKRETLDLDSPYVHKSRRLAEPRVECLAQFVDANEPASIFEIGAGVGQFQAAARERTRWQTSGLEPGNEQSALCRRQGLDVAHSFFQDLPIANESFDVVVSFHVIEHVDSPSEFLRHVNRILRPEGLLYLEVPNLLRSGEAGLSHFFQFPHLFNFTATTLRNYLTAVGGFRTIYVDERLQNLSVIARRSGPATSAPAQAGQFERFDVPHLLRRLRTLERLRALARWIPPWSVLGKVRSTLGTV